jgi:hypothetical protein
VKRLQFPTCRQRAMPLQVSEAAEWGSVGHFAVLPLPPSSPDFLYLNLSGNFFVNDFTARGTTTAP